MVFSSLISKNYYLHDIFYLALNFGFAVHPQSISRLRTLGWVSA